MSEWISVKDRLPMFDDQPTYDWVIVSAEDLRWTIARYGHKNINGKINPSWEFYDTNEDIAQCCYAGDAVNSLSIDEIAYWLEIPKTPKERKIEAKIECKNYGHSFTSMPHDNKICIRCGVYEIN